MGLVSRRNIPNAQVMACRNLCLYGICQNRILVLLHIYSFTISRKCIGLNNQNRPRFHEACTFNQVIWLQLRLRVSVGLLRILISSQNEGDILPLCTH
jgi:hypothetical protein